MSIGFLNSESVTLQKDTSTIFVTGDVDCSSVGSGTAIFLNGGRVLLEGLKGTAPDPLGKSTITLRKEYSGETLTDVSLSAFNTIEGLTDAIRRARDITDQSQNKLDNLQFSDFLTKTGSQVSLDVGGSVIETTPYSTVLIAVQDLLSKRNFTDLKDAPSLYTGSKGKVLSVKQDETGLEFITPPTGEGSGGAEVSTELADMPQDLSGKGGKILEVNSEETGYNLVPRNTVKTNTLSGDWSMYVDVSEESVNTFTLTERLTSIVFQNIPTEEGKSVEVTLILTQGVGSGEITWPEGVIWQNGREPVLSYQKGSQNILVFNFINGSPNPYGFFVAGWME